MPILPIEDERLGNILQPNRLEDLARLFVLNQQMQPKEETGPKMIMAGGRILGQDVTQPSTLDRLGQGLNTLATNYLLMQKMQRQRKLMQDISTIMGSNSNLEDTTDEEGNIKPGKKSQMLQLLLSYGDELPEQLQDVRNTLMKDIGKNGQVPVYLINPITGKPEITGNIPKSAKTFKGITPPEIIEQRELSKAKGQVTAQEMKKSAEAQRNFEIAKNKLRTTAAAFKAMVEREGAGRVGGAKRVITGATGINPYVKPFEGQLVEAAAALAKLAAPSARVGQEIIEQFKKTLPTKYSTWDEFTSQIRFSLHNAFSTALAGSGQEYDQNISDMVDSWVDELVNVEPLSIGGGSLQERKIKSLTLPSGKTIQLGR